jgi:hypothetical protein
LILQVHAASVQDRDGAIPLLQASRPLYPFIERVFADSAYAADRVATATRIIVEIVRKQAGQIGFAGSSQALGGRTLPCLDWAQPPSGEGLQRNPRIGNSLPLCRFRLVAHSTTRSFGLRFESDSKRLLQGHPVTAGKRPGDYSCDENPAPTMAVCHALACIAFTNIRYRSSASGACPAESAAERRH